MDANEGRYCEHIEDQLPKMGSYKSAQLVYLGDIGNRSEACIYGGLTSDNLPAFEENLRNAGLPEADVQLVLSRFNDKLTFEQMKEEFNFKNREGSRDAIRRIIKQLKKRGYNYDGT